jgi:hypothetical protein
MSLIFRTWMRLAATDKHQSWMHKRTNKQTNKQTVSQTKSRLNGTHRGLQQRDDAGDARSTTTNIKKKLTEYQYWHLSHLTRVFDKWINLPFRTVWSTVGLFKNIPLQPYLFQTHDQSIFNINSSIHDVCAFVVVIRNLFSVSQSISSQKLHKC